MATTDANTRHLDGTVWLNIYDLSSFNKWGYYLGIGAFHSGLEVYGSEWGYGSHPDETTGVFRVRPRSTPGYKFRCSLFLGKTALTKEESKAAAISLHPQYPGNAYHILSKNCNHFTDMLARKLLDRGIPQWVNRLARIGHRCSCMLPFLVRIPVRGPTASEGGKPCDADSNAPSPKISPKMVLGTPLLTGNGDMSSQHGGGNGEIAHAAHSQTEPHKKGSTGGKTLDGQPTPKPALCQMQSPLQRPKGGAPAAYPTEPRGSEISCSPKGAWM
eukprot:jgi/Mesvir1/23871/Mv10666-RA.1